MSCRYHLAEQFRGQPEPDPFAMEETCALDVADRGPLTLHEVGQILGITRERVRQIQEQARRRIKRSRWRMKLLEEAQNEEADHGVHPLVSLAERGGF